MSWINFLIMSNWWLVMNKLPHRTLDDMSRINLQIGFIHDIITSDRMYISVVMTQTISQSTPILSRIDLLLRYIMFYLASTKTMVWNFKSLSWLLGTPPNLGTYDAWYSNITMDWCCISFAMGKRYS